MQTDVLASVPLTADGQFKSQSNSNIARCRIKSIYIVPSGTAGSLVIKDGGTSGNVLVTVNTVASATQPTYLLMPGEGLLVQTSPYGAVTSLGSATIFYA
jgi:hypothetical protein